MFVLGMGESSYTASALWNQSVKFNLMLFKYHTGALVGSNCSLQFNLQPDIYKMICNMYHIFWVIAIYKILNSIIY